MKRTIRSLIAACLTAVMVMGGAGAALGNPNKAGKSGHFHPGSNPCASDNNHPNCPGPH